MRRTHVALWATALTRDLAAGDRLDAVISACWLGRTRRHAGHQAEATEAIEHGLAIVGDGNQLPGELMLSAEAALLDIEAQALDRAELHLTRCDAIMSVGEEWAGLAGRVLTARAAFHAARGEHRLARQHRASAVEVLSRYSLPWLVSDTQLTRQ